MTRSALALVAAWFLSLAEPASAQSIWFTPAPRLGQNADYMALFQPNAPWQQVASKVAVFAVGGQFVFTAPDDILRQIFDDIKRRGNRAAHWHSCSYPSGWSCTVRAVALSTSKAMAARQCFALPNG